MAGKVLTDNLSVTLNGATSAKVDINSGIGNLAIDKLAGEDRVLASGALQYFEKQGLPTRLLDSSNGRAALSLTAAGAKKGGFHFPWAACAGAIEWRIHLNPTVASEVIAHTEGGNIKLNLAGTAVTQVSADTGGGNIDVVLPDNVSNQAVTAKSGGGDVTVDLGCGRCGVGVVTANSTAGNVVVRIPDGVAAVIHASSRLGKVIVDPRFGRTGNNEYQSPDYGRAANKVEINIHSGAGNARVMTR